MSKTTRFTRNSMFARNDSPHGAVVKRVEVEDQKHTCAKCGKVLGTVGFLCDVRATCSVLECYERQKKTGEKPAAVVYLCWDCMVAASAKWKRDRLGISGYVETVEGDSEVACVCGMGNIAGTIDVSYPEVFDGVLSSRKRFLVERENGVHQLWGCRECMSEFRRDLGQRIVDEIVNEKKLTLKYHQWSCIVENIDEHFLSRRQEAVGIVPPRGVLDGSTLCETYSFPLPRKTNLNLDLSLLASALYSVQGVAGPANGGLYHVADGSAVFHLYFNSILKLNRFLWAFQQRYGHIGRNSRTWHLSIDNGTNRCNGDTLMVTLTGKPENGRIQQEDVDKLTCQILQWLDDEKKPGGIATYSENSKAAAEAYFKEHPSAEYYAPDVCGSALSENYDE